MRQLRKILWPIAIGYDAVTRLRNFLYDVEVFKSQSYNFPVIGVGNLSVGGTGKSPMIEYLIRLLKDEGQLATLSRGYRRKSKGFILAQPDSIADDIGDEPLQFHSKFPNVAVAVDADRQHGIEKLQQLINPDILLLDDVFQHRKVTAGFYIVLTKYDDLFVDDLILPAGNLRESKCGINRADVVIVTKCPSKISKEKQQSIVAKLNVNQKVYFTSIGYANEIIGAKHMAVDDLKSINFTLVTGIANPKPLVDYLRGKQLQFEHLAYKDHHNFTDSQLEELSQKELILTTEKDYMRLKDKIQNVCYLPIVTEFVTDELAFQNSILSFVKK